MNQAPVQKWPAQTTWLGRCDALISSMFVAVLLRTLSLSRTFSIVQWATRLPISRRASAQQIVADVDWALSRRRPLLRRNCLRRTLTLFLMLRRLGLPVIAHLGVIPPKGFVHSERAQALDGHAWLSLAGAVVYEPALSRVTDYTETLRLPAA